MIVHRRHKHFLQTASLVLIVLSGFLLMTIPALASDETVGVTQTVTPYLTSSPTMFLVTLTPTPTIPPFPTFDIERLDKPVVGDVPSQMENGLLVFWGICMACHGDRGQGLTDDWRESYGEDRDCWTSKCHASNHPPQCFEFPKLVPSLIGEGTLLRFVNAEQLYNYNLESMPWWDPGSLTDDKAMAITAYLMIMNGRVPDGTILSTMNADFYPVQYSLSKSPGSSRVWKFLLAGALFLAAIGIGVQSSGLNNGKRPNFFLHLHPPTIPAPQARFRYTLGLGGLAVFLCLILLITGVLEMYYYVPSVERAASSVQEITYLVPFGDLVRNLHFFSAQVLAIIAAVHLLRVVFTGAYTKPRRFNYLLGVALFVIILLLDFTGYVLRWDEGIRWALIAGTNLLGSIPKIGETLVRFISGNIEPGPAMLIRFYTWHIFGLSTIGGIIVIWHLFRVRRDGGITAPSSAYRTDNARITRFELLRRELIAMLVAGATLILAATFFQAPIAQPMNVLLVSLTESRAPWFFLWVQELLKFGDPFLWGILGPFIVLTILAIIPYIFPGISESEHGRWFPRSGRAVQILVSIILVTIIILTVLAIFPSIQP